MNTLKRKINGMSGLDKSLGIAWVVSAVVGITFLISTIGVADAAIGPLASCQDGDAVVAHGGIHSDGRQQCHVGEWREVIAYGDIALRNDNHEYLTLCNREAGCHPTN